MRILVYSATGSQGGGVARAALKRGHTPVLFTRSPEKAEMLKGMGAEIFPGDLEDENAVRTATESVDAVAITIPTFGPPHLYPVFARRTVDAAAAAGKYFSFNTSGPVIPQRVGFPMYDGRLDILDMIRASGGQSVILKPTAYMENLMGPWTRPNVIQHDQLSYPLPDDVRIGWVATDDVGAFMIAALEHPELAGSEHIISGARNLNGLELAAAFSEGVGRPISYRAMPLSEFAAALDAMFCPGAGENGAAGYRFQHENRDLIPMFNDGMAELAARLNVEMTSLAAWAGQFKVAFAKDAPLQMGMPG
ncbi:MAG: NmrA family NAD(P)-binding protein [bacterium]|nr:NmrA family NAD(P)-binding protein [bacterium]